MTKLRAEDLLALARKELGYKETPPRSNRTKYGAWYHLDGQPWCMMFVMWLYNRLDALDLLPRRTASCGQFMSAAKKAGKWITSGYKPGDVLIFTFGKSRIAEHCGILESVGNSGTLVTIEGNTAVNDNSNGGEVMRRYRQQSSVLGAFRPAYTAAVPKTLAEAARAVLDGRYGTGADRRAALTRDGFTPAVVQQIVNELAAGSRKTAETLAREVWAGKWGVNPERKERLTAAGYNYTSVCKAVNALARSA